MIRRFLCCVAAVVASGCQASPSAPSTFTVAALPTAAVTDAFEYRYATDDTVDVSWQEAYHRWALAALEISPPRRIRYNKYRDRAHMQSVIGVGNTNAFADGNAFEIHTIWSRDNHEVVHLYSSAFGRPVALWSEGLAVAFQVDPAAGGTGPRWSGVPLDDLARDFKASGRLVAVADLLTTDGFRRFDPNVTYPEAGSFVRFVLDTCGLGNVKRLFATGSVQDSAATVSAHFETVCGGSLASAEQAWLSRLGTR